MTHGRVRATVMAAAVAASLAVTPVVSGAPKEPEPALPILGQTVVAATSDDEERLAPMVVTVHGLRRHAGATILYYSVGFAEEAPDPEIAPVTAYGSGPGTFETLQSAPGATFMETAAAIDVAARTSYGALRRADGDAVAGPPPVEEEDRLRLSGRAIVQWIALAPVPAKTTIVDVLIGSAFLKSIPVANGPLTPLSEKPAPAVGTGWPEINPFEVEKGTAQNAVLPLQPHVAKVTPPRTPTPTATPTPTPSGATPTPSPSASQS